MASRSLDDLTPAARVAAFAFLVAVNVRLKEKGLKALVVCTYRPQSEQDGLWAQGRTKPGKIVTWTHRSKHTKRRAWDLALVSLKTGRIVWRDPGYQIIGQVAKAQGLRWGGSYGDFGHVEAPA